MATVVVTGSAGLVGSEAVGFFAQRGFNVVGIDNDMRGVFFGPAASTKWNGATLARRWGKQYYHCELDIRERLGVEALFQEYSTDIALVIHTAAQPSHDWAARDPHTDFTVNANGTLTLLEAMRRHAPQAVFIFTSTNKVYGDSPNRLPLHEMPTRWEIDPSHPYAPGIDESMSIDDSKHSLFGASKVAADVLVQEYGRYFGLRTGVFRAGCVTGPAHSGTELHGFLAYLMKCTVEGKAYIVTGYRGKQVRDNLHSYDLVNAFYSFYQAPRAGAVYNIGGSRQNNCSVLEAIALCEEVAAKKLAYAFSDEGRSGDHIWYISDVRKFQAHHPQWAYRFDLRSIAADIYKGLTSRAAA